VSRALTARRDLSALRLGDTRGFLKERGTPEWMERDSHPPGGSGPLAAYPGALLASLPTTPTPTLPAS
jgi:hypothetical protein